MQPQIITTCNNRLLSADKPDINFDKIHTDSVRLEMRMDKATAKKDIIWEIYSNGVQLDAGDLTVGEKAELIIQKSYAGSLTQPHVFTVLTKNANRAVLASQHINVAATPAITDAYWGGADKETISEVGFNTNFTAYIQGYGLYQIPLTIKVYLQAKSGDVIEIDTRQFYIDSLYDIKSFYFNYKRIFEHAGFFAKAAPYLFSDMFWGQQYAVTGAVKQAAIAEAFFKIYHGERLLFDGKRKNKLIRLTPATSKFEEMSAVLSPVTVYTEEYFTQKYELCKYEKIVYRHGTEAEVTVFDEKEPVTANKGGNPLSQKASLAIIVPPKGSKNIKDLVIRLEAVSTNDCQFTAPNKSRTNFGGAQSKKDEQPHQGRVIDTMALKEADITVTENEADRKVTVKPSFNYLYNEKSAWEFLKHYFLFSSVLSNTDTTHNELKGVLMDWEIKNKELINVYRIGLETCRYNKGLYLKLFADVAWAFHLFYDEPTDKKYYLEDKSIKTVKGLEAELGWLQDNNQKFEILTPIDVLGVRDSIQDFVLELVKEMADKYELGFTAYYDFTANGICDKRIEYAEKYPVVCKTAIATAVTMEILIQALLFILTRGASGRLALAKLSKSGVSMSGKLGAIAKDAVVTIDRDRRIARLSGAAEKVYATLTTPAFTYYKGYRFVEHPDIGIEPLLEERMVFDPVFDIQYGHEDRSLGDLIVSNTPVGAVIDLTKKALGFVKVGFNRFILNKDGRENATLWDKGIKLIEGGLDTVQDYLGFLTDRILKEVLGAEARYTLTISGKFKMDFELKVHNASKKLDLSDFFGKGSAKDASVVKVAPAAGIEVEMKGSARINVPVRALNILNYSNLTRDKYKEVSAEGRLEVVSGKFWERAYYFHAGTKEPYYQDSVIFTGIGGEYEHNVAIKKRDQKNKKTKNTDINLNQKLKKFMLIPPQVITHDPVPVFRNPS